MVPTRFMERKEFDELVEAEGTTLPLFRLAAIPFSPPAPAELGEPIDYDNYKAVRILMLNVAEPRLYRDQAGIVFVVLPSFDVVTYDIAKDCHPINDAWCYRFSPYNWDKNSTLHEAVYLFEEGSIPAFELENLDTH